MMSDLDRMFYRLAKSKYRGKFSLSEKDLRYIERKGLDVIREHAYEFVQKRIAPAQPEKDGRQTPMRTHPVFVAQHATGTCCRLCLKKCHRIERNRELSEAEIDYIVYIIMSWIERDMEKAQKRQQYEQQKAAASADNGSAAAEPVPAKAN